MRRSLLLATICLIAALPVPLCAQPAPRPLEPSRVNAARIRWLEYRLVAGRIVATSNYPDGMNISFGPSTVEPGVREALQLLILKDQASIRYSLVSADESLLVSLDETGQFEVRRRRAAPPWQLYFGQPRDKPLILAVQEAGKLRVLAGESLWHLYLSDPELVGRELFPILELLRPNWQLVITGEQIEHVLVTGAVRPRASDSGRWGKLIAQLASTQFSERETAERELLQAGQRVLPFLRQLDVNQLDAEQVARIARLKAELEVNYEDNVDRVTSVLQSDVAAWLSIAGRDDLGKRILAKTQIQAILNRQIEFDPAADPAVRAAQLRGLQSRWLPPADEAAEAEALKRLGSVPPPVGKQ